jgi:hypothetical protein
LEFPFRGLLHSGTWYTGSHIDGIVICAIEPGEEGSISLVGVVVVVVVGYYLFLELDRIGSK